MHEGYIVKIENLRPHLNADRLQITTIFGLDVCVDMSVALNDIGVYFPIDLQLSEEFCIKNNLLRPIGYMDPDKRNVKAISLRGSRSEGLYLPLSTLYYTGITNFNVGDTITILNGKEICRKYIPKLSKSTKPVKSSKTTRKKLPEIPLFLEHVDTEQWAFNKDKIKNGDDIEVTLKCHGSSARTAYLPVPDTSFFGRLFHRKKWDYVSGTRRTVLDTFDKGGFYGDNLFRKPYHEYFKSKLHKGEEVYYEIVGWVNKDTPIMGQGTVPQEARSVYGDVMTFDYGLERGASDIYVYRMTMTNEDGDVVEYEPSFMRRRCAEMGVKSVPVFERRVITNGAEEVDEIVNKYVDGPDPIGRSHVREGVVIRVINRPVFTAYKAKNFLFKQITGIIKENATVADADIASEL